MGNRFLNIHSLLYKPACTTTYTVHVDVKKERVREREILFILFLPRLRVKPNLTWLGTNVALVNSIIDYGVLFIDGLEFGADFSVWWIKWGKNETEITDFLTFEFWNSRSRVPCTYSVFIYRVCNVCFKFSRGVRLCNKPHGAESYDSSKFRSFVFLYVKFSSTTVILEHQQWHRKWNIV